MTPITSFVNYKHLKIIMIYIKSVLFRELNLFKSMLIQGFHGGSDGKESTCNTGNLGLIPALGRSPGGSMATHSSILA